MSRIDLTHLDRAYQDAEIEEREMGEVPDGSYQVNVEKVALKESKTSCNPMLSWELKVLGPNHRGRRIFRNSMIVTPDNVRYLKQDLHLCGLELDRLSDLPTRLDELLDTKLEVVVKTKGEYTNVYLNRRLILDDDGEPLPEGGDAEGDTTIVF